MATIKAGTILYHGTDCDDFEEGVDDLEGPSWLSSSKDVARHFATRDGGWGGTKRIIAYELTEDVLLPEITSSSQLQTFAKEHDLCLLGVEEIRKSIEQAGIPGWIIPNNYPEGDDILLADTRVLRYQKTELCQERRDSKKVRP